MVNKHTVLLATGATVLLCTAAGSSDEPPRSDLDRFQGEWTLEWMERDGKKLVDDEGRNLGLRGGVTIRCVGKGKLWTLGEQEPWSIEVDSTASPKRIDITILFDTKRDADGKSKVTYKKVEGIFRIHGDTLVWCFSETEGEKRPTAFETKNGGVCMLAFKKLTPKQVGK